MKKGKPISEIVFENEKIIKYATIYCIVYSIIVIGLIIALIYCKVNGL